MAEKRQGFKYITALPKGEQFVGMIMWQDTLMVASTKSVYWLNHEGDNPGLEKIQIRIEDKPMEVPSHILNTKDKDNAR